MARDELAFGRFRLQPGRQLLLDGRPLSLGAKPLNILTVLVAAGGDLVTKNELIERVWPGTVVEENALQAHISALRKVLGEDGGRIATVPGRGYRFDDPIEHVAVAGTSPELQGGASAAQHSATARRQRIRPWMAALAVAAVILAVAAVSWQSVDFSSGKAVHVERYLVLPFVNRTGDPRNENFADALTDAVSGRIGTRFWDSEVLGHTQAFVYKGREVDGAKLARQLDLSYIVEGSLLTNDGRIEALATIIDAVTGTQIGSVTKRARDGEDETQAQWLSAGLVDQVQWTVTRAHRREVVAGKVADGDIRNVLIRAKIAMDGPSLHTAWPKVVALLDQALKLDRHNVHALCNAAAARIQYSQVFAFNDEAERTAMLNAAEALLDEAVRIDPTRTMLHLMRGDLRIAQGRHDAALAEYQRALDLDPLSADALEGLAVADIFKGEPQAALLKLNRALAISPDDVYLIDGDLASLYMTTGQDAEALAAIRQAATANSGDTATWMALAGLLQLNGHPDEARAALTTLRRLNPDITIAKLRLADANASSQFQYAQERLYAALHTAGLE
ncbi:MAG: transcriptional regulator domain protein [Rhodospirillales bacterium]|nr:transcriptional regulator domain protein [Rhodospirillales bacterium]